MESNAIDSLPESFLSGLTQLQYVRMAHNQLTDKGIPPHIFNVTGLVELDLSFNKLERIPPVSSTLQHLYLQANQIKGTVSSLHLRLRSVFLRTNQHALLRAARFTVCSGSIDLKTGRRVIYFNLHAAVKASPFEPHLFSCCMLCVFLGRFFFPCTFASGSKNLAAAVQVKLNLYKPRAEMLAELSTGVFVHETQMLTPKPPHCPVPPPEFTLGSFCSVVDVTNFSRLQTLRLDGNDISRQDVPSESSVCLRLASSIEV